MRQFILTGLVTVIMTMTYGQDLKNEDKELIKTEIQRMLKSDQKYRSLLSYGTLRQETADSIKSLSNDEQMKFMMSNKKKLAKNISDSLWTVQNNLDLENIIVRWSCLGGHFFCQISKQILFKTEDGETHPLAVNRSVLGGARKVI